ncbi:hypothetical protein Hypma_014033 [Hypsizygus marmoreus]|uniref:Uncharacterized protein n=1 Tax=Hypsizygus marmoreus TaxID=39966 RepID=A0A369KB57_HYPMA|nr:hypothetical protein Hypma_014033 [Hypsizygus marmoreus]
MLNGMYHCHFLVLAVMLFTSLAAAAPLALQVSDTQRLSINPTAMSAEFISGVAALRRTSGVGAAFAGSSLDARLESPSDILPPSTHNEECIGTKPKLRAFPTRNAYVAAVLDETRPHEANSEYSSVLYITNECTTDRTVELNYRDSYSLRRSATTGYAASTSSSRPWLDVIGDARIL